MQARLSRPQPVYDPEKGLFLAQHFQVAYATNDLEQAMRIFADDYGVSRFTKLEGPLPQGGYIHIELAWAGDVMYELLTASGPGSEVYVEALPADRFAIRHHHLGYMVHDADAWEGLRAAVKRKGWRVRADANIEGFMRQMFVEAPQLGHLLEFLWPEPAGVAFFDSVATN